VARGVWRVVRGNAALIFSADPSIVWRDATAIATGSVVAGVPASRGEAP
jgi:hypothetical protein